jgi:hypothetical protein
MSSNWCLHLFPGFSHNLPALCVKWYKAMFLSTTRRQWWRCALSGVPVDNEASVVTLGICRVLSHLKVHRGRVYVRVNMSE